VVGVDGAVVVGVDGVVVVGVDGVVVGVAAVTVTDFTVSFPALSNA
jgi:hypothetical protein